MTDKNNGKVKLVCGHCATINQFDETKDKKEAKCGKCKQNLVTDAPIVVSLAELEKHIQHSAFPVLVDFWAPWCGPCKMFAPTFESYASKTATTVRCLKLNTEEHQQAGAKFNIRSIPTLALFSAGKELNRISGAMNEPQLTEWVNQAL